MRSYTRDVTKHQRIPQRVGSLRWLSTASERFLSKLLDFHRSRVSVQLSIVQCGESVDVLGDEVGDVEAGVNEEWITHDDFAREGGAADSTGLRRTA